MTSSEQVRQLEALARLQAGLEAVTAEDASRFSSMVIRLYHPDSSPFDPFGTAAELESSSSFDTGQIQVVYHPPSPFDLFWQYATELLASAAFRQCIIQTPFDAGLDSPSPSGMHC